eukprot:gnl/MRDRNA2_/MRDRNA2_35828_c0_seq1.p1 gnl/MRDRNA2_/MRDRNA2_35828_c0~~gnl/MRDRNA2_/MRDRNA2_35828_c0_seq1.p1  ORF type:complete len:453 (+),score=69.84 gnl/MRDRNA2_/MRDRNA2_35828_c0_seq1:164-1522(+)
MSGYPVIECAKVNVCCSNFKVWPWDSSSIPPSMPSRCLSRDDKQEPGTARLDVVAETEESFPERAQKRKSTISVSKAATSALPDHLRKRITLCDKADFSLPPANSMERRTSKEPVQHSVQTLSYQASGHANSLFEPDEGSRDILWKKCDDIEYQNYKEIFDNGDSMQHCLPQFFGRIEGECNLENANEDKPEPFIIIENLLLHFYEPLVMDCKIGIRSFEEKECKSKKGRPDMYERLLKLGPEYLTEEEHQQRSITKFKWMSTRDKMSSLQSLGFRIDGIVGPNAIKVHADYYANISDRAVVVQEIRKFLDYLPENLYSQAERLGIQSRLASEVVAQVSQHKTNCMTSNFFSFHSFVGCSLLIVVESCIGKAPPKACVRIIDLAKTSKVPDEVKIDHMRDWAPGNHEDGLLKGLENVVDCWTEVESSIRKDLNGCKKKAESQVFSPPPRKSV